MIRVLLAGKLNAGVAENLKAIPEFEIKEIAQLPFPLPENELNGIDAAVLDAAIKADRDFLSKARDLRILVRPVADPGDTDIEFARSRGVDIRCTPFATAGTVADYAVALLLSCLFRIGPAYYGLRMDSEARFEIHEALRMGRKLTLGIVGFGRIGGEVGRRAFNLGMEILYSDIEEVQTGFPARRMPFEHLMSTADLVSLHLPLNSDTRDMVSAEQFSGMKPGSVIVDLSAPGIVNVPALLDALQSGRLGAAALDVQALPVSLRKRAAGISGIYPVTGEALLAGGILDRSGNDVVSILKEFFNV